MKNTCLLFISIFLLFACNNEKTDSFDAAARENTRVEVEKMLGAYHQAISEGGLKAEFVYLDSSDQFFWVPPGYESALNFDSVKSILLQNDKAMKQVDFHWEELELFVLSPKIVNFTGIVGGQMLDTAGIYSPVHIIESGTCIKRDDGWKLLSGQSALLPTSR